MIPWSVCDLAWIRPVARTPGGVDVPLKLNVEGDELVLSCGGITRAVSRCSELYVMPWATVVRHYWPGYGLVARRIFRMFFELVDSGAVQLIDRGPRKEYGLRPLVKFDVPIPAVGRRSLLGIEARAVNLHGAWRYTAKSKRKECGPPLLDRCGFTPSWWPDRCVHGGFVRRGRFPGWI